MLACSAFILQVEHFSGIFTIKVNIDSGYLVCATPTVLCPFF